MLDKEPHDAHQNAVGMLAGSAGMIAYAVVAAFAGYFLAWVR